jgi:hypothetical protein
MKHESKIVPSDTGILGSNPIRGIFVCDLLVFVFSYVRKGLSTN